MIESVTSLADLIFKAKTQDPYRQLLILTVNELFSEIEDKTFDTYEESLKFLNEKINGIDSCDSIVSTINFYRQCIPDPRNSSKINNLGDKIDKILQVENPCGEQYQYQTIERININIYTGQRNVVRRRIPSNILPSLYNDIIEDMNTELDEMSRIQNRNHINWNGCSPSNPCELCRSLDEDGIPLPIYNEDNPNNDR